MSRKRSISSIINDDKGESFLNQSFAISSHATSSRRRAVSDIINKETITNRPSSNRRLSICNCPKCNGRLVDSCTKEIHEIRFQSSQGEISAAIFQLKIQEEMGDDHEQYGEASIPVSDTLGQRTIETFERITDDDDEHQEDSEFSVLP